MDCWSGASKNTHAAQQSVARSRADPLLCRWAKAGECQVRLLMLSPESSVPQFTPLTGRDGLPGESLLHAQRVLCQLPHVHQAAFCPEALARLGRRVGHQVLGHKASAPSSCRHHQCLPRQLCCVSCQLPGRQQHYFCIGCHVNVQKVHSTACSQAQGC